MANILPPTSSVSLMERNAYDAETERLEKHGRRIATVSSTLTAILRILTFLIQSVNHPFLTNSRISVAATSAASLQQFYKTRNDTNGSQSLWSPTTMLWPTFLTLIAAVIILIYNGIVIGAYCCGKNAVDRWAGYDHFFTAIQTTLSTIAAGVTLGTAVLADSLNSQTCSPAADAKQPSFPQVNLGHICIMQVQYLFVDQS
jgi:hypothetical protein